MSRQLFLATNLLLFGASVVDRLEQELQEYFEDAEKIVIVGIGNPNRSDDYVGLKIVEELKGNIRKDICLLEGETVPESYLLEIEESNPTHILLIDAAIIKRNPGDVCLVQFDDVPAFSAISSHVLPIRLFCEYIQKATTSKIKLLLIEPKSVEFSEGLSPEALKATQKITQILRNLLS